MIYQDLTTDKKLGEGVDLNPGRLTVGYLLSNYTASFFNRFLNTFVK